MFFIIRGKNEKQGAGQYSMSNPEYRESYYKTKEKIEHIAPRDLSPLRRKSIRTMRFAGKTPELVAEAAAIRKVMEDKINK